MQQTQTIYFALTLVLITLSWGSNNPLVKQASATPARSAARSNHRIVEATGKVELKREGASNFRVVYNHTELRPGDLLRLASGAKVRVLCNNGNTRPVPAGVTTGVNAICPPPRERNGPTVTPRPGDAYIPYIISPRATLILTDKPTLRWNDATDAKSFTVMVRGRGLNWTEEFRRERVCQDGICKVVYPSNEPLQPGVNYKLVVKADTNRTSEEDTTGGLGFKRIESSKAQEVRAVARRIETQDLSKEFKGLALAELYADYNLNAEAIEILEGLGKGEKTASVYRLLGDSYRRIGLVLEAEVQYLEAVKLAKATENLDELAAANAGLGEVKYARGNREAGVSLLEEAKAIYQRLEDRQGVNELAARLTELKR